MKLFDKKAEKRVWLSVLISIPVTSFVLWKYSGEFSTQELIILIITYAIGIGVIYSVKYYANK